jgi:phage tail sheath protein FI
MLYQAQVNPIVHFPEGMTVWGQLTTQKKSSSLSDLNVVRTVLYIKRAIEQYCQNYIFEMNDSTTWNSIQMGIQPMLDTIVANGGLRSYSVEVGATDYELKTKMCHVNVTLEPMKVLEKIQLNLYIK